MRLMDTFVQHGRALEWLTSSVLLAFAVILAMPGNTLAISPSFGGFVASGLDEASISMPLSLIASMRMAGLWINGNWQRSPFLRLFGAIFGAGTFAALAMMFAMPFFSGAQDALSTGVGAYAVLAAFDMLAAYRSGADVGLSKRDR